MFAHDEDHQQSVSFHLEPAQIKLFSTSGHQYTCIYVQLYHSCVLRACLNQYLQIICTHHIVHVQCGLDCVNSSEMMTMLYLQHSFYLHQYTLYLLNLKTCSVSIESHLIPSEDTIGALRWIPLKSNSSGVQLSTTYVLGSTRYWKHTRIQNLVNDFDCNA